MYENLKLENYATKIRTNKLHHLYQNNIDQASYDGGFENYFDNTFCCSECIENKMKQIPPYHDKLFDNETSENEELDDEVVVVDDNVIEVNDDDSDCSEHDSEYSDEEDKDIEGDKADDAVEDDDDSDCS